MLCVIIFDYDYFPYLVPTSASNFESPSSSDGRTVVATDYVDKCSMGGEAESVGSAEYETVSLIEETGVCMCVCLCTCGCVLGGGG